MRKGAKNVLRLSLRTFLPFHPLPEVIMEHRVRFEVQKYDGECL